MVARNAIYWTVQGANKGKSPFLMHSIVDKISGKAGKMGPQPSDLVGYLVGQDRISTEM